MSNPSKKKGTDFETSLLPTLKKLDPRVERSALKGTKDAGDFTRLFLGHVSGIPAMVVSAKNCRHLDLSGWLKEAEQQRIHANADAAICVHKKRGTTKPEEQYCSMTLGTLLRLLT